MMTVVFFDPADGRIIESRAIDPRVLALMTGSWIAVPEYRPDYDQTHRVVGGQLVPIGE